eukprot:CAMPEP_0183735134 /NCGR_PEP_ID=MMETSP0737-20130205/45797_1 /TAXON_ID=385413 /ORGANISM="Thalassiosira miniscula, Strain CCMP1093" /LENGTH=281 /DNA_ID=CAMNT_0025968791 /DNA_START=102 /DNA_END=944 /DNA_ORIENTATION=-
MKLPLLLGVLLLRKTTAGLAVCDPTLFDSLTGERLNTTDCECAVDDPGCSFPDCVSNCRCTGGGGGCSMPECLTDCLCPDGNCVMDGCISNCENGGDSTEAEPEMPDNPPEITNINEPNADGDDSTEGVQNAKVSCRTTVGSTQPQVNCGKVGEPSVSNLFFEVIPLFGVNATDLDEIPAEIEFDFGIPGGQKSYTGIFPTNSLVYLNATHTYQEEGYYTVGYTVLIGKGTGCETLTSKAEKMVYVGVDTCKYDVKTNSPTVSPSPTAQQSPAAISVFNLW